MEGSVDSVNVDGLSCGKLMVDHAAALKAAEGPLATLKVNGESRRRTESRLKLTEGPAAMQNVDKSSHRCAES